MRLSDLASLAGGELLRDSEEFQTIGIPGEAGPGRVVFLMDPKQADLLRVAVPCAAVVRREITSLSCGQLIHSDPLAVFATAVQFLCPEEVLLADGTEDGEGTTDFGPDVFLGAFTTVAAGVTLGKGTRVGPHCYIGRGVRVGANATLGPRVTLLPGTSLGDGVTIRSGTVVGSPGFRYRWDGQTHQPIPHIGRVVLEDHVTLGSNCTVNRGVIGETRIGEGTRIDDQVHIAHNVRIGKQCLIAAQCGIAGSAVLGDRVLLGGQCGVSDHAVLEDDVMVSAQSGIRGRVPARQVVSGTPQMPHRTWRRVVSSLPYLPALLKRSRLAD